MTSFHCSGSLIQPLLMAPFLQFHPSFLTRIFFYKNIEAGIGDILRICEGELIHMTRAWDKEKF